MCGLKLNLEAMQVVSISKCTKDCMAGHGRIEEMSCHV